MIKKWERLERVAKSDYRVFRVNEDRSRSPRTGKDHTFSVVEAPDWVNIIPVTPAGQIVLIRQYRHGTEEITLEIPGGMIDPGEDAATAARREMHEETGYDTEHIVYLGKVDPNPAIQNNTCYSYLARNAQFNSGQQLDSSEDIEVLLVNPGDVPKLIGSAQITHALVIAAFYFLEQHLKTHPDVF